MNVVEGIIKARNEGGKFKDIYDFFERVPAGVINRRVVDNLAIAGAFDCFPRCSAKISPSLIQKECPFQSNS